MRIDPNSGGQPVAEAGRSSNQTAARGTTPTSPSASTPLGEDQTQLSGVDQAQALLAQLSQLPETSQQKVEALRQAVAIGKYQVDPQQVAGALFSNMVKLVA